MGELISVIVPVYNVKSYLQECVDSIIAQTYQNLEIILVDDGSTDGSSEMCDALQTADSRIKVLHENNQGLSAARNFGIDHATGKYIAFADSDDVAHTMQYELLYRALCDTESDIACCGSESFLDGNITDEENAKGEIAESQKVQQCSYTGYTQEYLCDQNVLALFNRYTNPNPMGYVWNKLYRREVIGDVRFPIGRKVQDYHFNVDVFARAGRLIKIQEKLYRYRLRRGSAQNAGGENLTASRDMIAAFCHQIEVFAGQAGRQELIQCVSNHLNLFARRETFCYAKKYDASRTLFREAFLTVYREHRDIIKFLPDRNKIYLARYCPLVYHILKKKDVVQNEMTGIL